ncbi:hypothetical protein RF11_00443 [Thelohanellus kitauei]|uniref:Uncharacterized protein n=1 Tax=Thelohanellus kitauei TaxID=669202 RepID=A0A0C2J6M7_THEKT|nr:hypothetical protein RF11_00443 [Thelohanellus kitauei]
MNHESAGSQSQPGVNPRMTYMYYQSPQRATLDAFDHLIRNPLSIDDGLNDPKNPSWSHTSCNGYGTLLQCKLRSPFRQSLKAPGFQSEPEQALKFLLSIKEWIQHAYVGGLVTLAAFGGTLPKRMFPRLNIPWIVDTESMLVCDSHASLD